MVPKTVKGPGLISASGVLQPWCSGFGREWFDTPFKGAPLCEI